MARQAQKSHFPFLFKIRGDEMGAVGLDKGDLGWGGSGGGGEGLVKLNERGEPGLETVQRLGHAKSSVYLSFTPRVSSQSYLHSVLFRVDNLQQFGQHPRWSYSLRSWVLTRVPCQPDCQGVT